MLQNELQRLNFLGIATQGKSGVEPVYRLTAGILGRRSGDNGSRELSRRAAAFLLCEAQIAELLSVPQERAALDIEVGGSNDTQMLGCSLTIGWLIFGLGDFFSPTGLSKCLVRAKQKFPPEYSSDHSGIKRQGLFSN